MPACIPSASTAYFAAIARSQSDGGEFADGSFLTDDFIGKLESLRDWVRAEEGGGGMCHVMSEILSNRHGWPMLSVAYLSEDGGMICAAHVVNILPGGAVLDTTRDQFGEGHSVSYIAPGSEEIGRYRPEFYEDFHPGHPDDTDGVMMPWADAYRGLTDSEEQDRIETERGRGWWLSDLSELDAFDLRQEEYANGPMPLPTMPRP